MRITVLTYCCWLIGIALLCNSCGSTPPTSTLDVQVEELLQSMSLEEKAGQMTNISLMALAKGDFWMQRDTIELDTAKINTLLLRHHVGSVQNLGTYPLSPEEWRKYIGQLQSIVQQETRLGIPLLYGIDGVHGANYTANSTLFPHQLGLAATWNPDLAEATGSITAYELRASGIPWNFAPVLDVSKQPLWGRIFETFGEDTYLTTVMAEAMIKGAQGESVSDFDKTAVCLKHFWGYGQPHNGKDRAPVYLPERLLRQYYLPPFERAVAMGAKTVMLNSASINGVPAHADHWLITELLKGELGFKGFTVSDWEDVVNLEKIHQVAKDEKEAVKLAVNAGLDMCMDPYDASFAQYLVELVEEGAVPIQRVDDAVRRILKVKMELGLFENTLHPLSEYDQFASVNFARKSYQCAVESMTLLKNQETTLPLDSTKKYLVTGPAAHSLTCLNGAWSRTWAGVDTRFNDPEKPTILDAIRIQLGAAQVKYEQGSDFDKPLDLAAAKRALQQCDGAIICLGEPPATEKPSDINTLELPDAQLALVEKLAETGKPLIVVLVLARPRIISRIEPLTDAILMAYLPGNEGGRAIAHTLFGKQNPSGKLPLTYPRYSGSIWAYDHTKADERDKGFGFEGFDPLYEFGYGLSYTQFEYDSLQLEKDTFAYNEPISLSVKVTNTGNRKGMEVVQLYSADQVASMVPAVRQLRRFSKINLMPGQSQRVSFSITAEDLGFVNRNNQWITESGDFTLIIDSLTTHFYLKTD